MANLIPKYKQHSETKTTFCHTKGSVRKTVMNSIYVAAVGSKAAKQHQYHMAVTTDESHKDNANKVQSLHLGIYWAVPPAPEFQLEVVHLLAAACPLQVHVASNTCLIALVKVRISNYRKTFYVTRRCAVSGYP